MTTNQIAYWANVEAARANKARESENRRSNLTREDLDLKDLNRNIKRDENTHQFNLSSLSETQRSNIANELLKGEQNKNSRYATEVNKLLGLGNLNLARDNLVQTRRRDEQNYDVNLRNVGINSERNQIDRAKVDVSNKVAENTAIHQANQRYYDRQKIDNEARRDKWNYQLGREKSDRESFGLFSNILGGLFTKIR